MTKIAPAFFIFALACGNDDGGALTDAGVVPCLESNFTSIQQGLLSTNRCATAGCHATNGQGGLTLSGSKTEVHAALVNAATMNGSASATYPNRVAPNQPDQSFLYIKVTDPNTPGGIMPPIGDRLRQCDVDALRAWITAGAAND